MTDRIASNERWIGAVPPNKPPGVRIAAWILAVSYGLGSSAALLIELRSQLFSARFDVPPQLLFIALPIQLVCAAGVLTVRYAPAAAVVLSVTTVGAALAHFRIGSPLTALPAIGYTVLQLWFAAAAHRWRSGPSTSGATR